MKRIPKSFRILVATVCWSLAALSFDSALADPFEAPLSIIIDDTAATTGDPTLSQPFASVLENADTVAVQDRVFLLSTRHLTSNACCATLEQPDYRMWQIECGRANPIDVMDYQASLSAARQVVIYVHGNRMPADDLMSRATIVRRRIDCARNGGAIDWVVYSWPSAREYGLLRDFREKADRCDAQGLYLASFLRLHAQAAVPTVVIGYSFGARVATGALHALAGGPLSGRTLQGPPLVGANIRVGLVAPAIESNWLTAKGYHGQATQNMEQLLLLYNRRDIVLKQYWLIEKVRRETALGFSGPTRFAARMDGSPLPVLSRDCSPSVKLRHSELDYYKDPCSAGRDMARLIDEARNLSF
ncbi:hypothetical protein NHH03_07075 [Stieleria sp. TO1_6]|uniref:hypothetical protein n=1 Tax=Stieleria tagensis TaxID=2956795 RepID=UPI00209AB2AA|nr:hypothetical protein [Stieleria tagensis]MCO8121493.1 hypothetical protein [Stieleria tagensis]